MADNGHLYPPGYRVRKFYNRGSRAALPNEHLVCALHGRDLMGWKSLYIFQEDDKESTLKSTSRRQGREGDRASERSRSANL